MVVLSCSGAINHTVDIICPALIGLDLEHHVVLALTVYAIANYPGDPHEVLRLPVSHTDCTEEKLWARFEAR
jgi:hypothetical protein